MSASDHLVSGLVPLGLLIGAAVDLPAVARRASRRSRARLRLSSACSAAPKARTTPGDGRLLRRRLHGAAVDRAPACCFWASARSRCGDRVEGTTSCSGGTHGGRCYVLAALLVGGVLPVPDLALRTSLRTWRRRTSRPRTSERRTRTCSSRRATATCSKGWYVPSRNGAAVISFPGRSGTRLQARMLARHGYGVLLFDRRGEGESEGDWNVFGWQGERDAARGGRGSSKRRPTSIPSGSAASVARSAGRC